MFRLEDRKSGFKKGIDASEGRRCRNETSIKLRKDKKEEGLAKRRAALTPSGLTTSSDGSSVGKNLYTVADIPQLAAALLQPNVDGAKLLDVVRGFRKILSVESNPPVHDVLQSGVLPTLVHMLTLNDKPDVQFEAAWALTNIASTDMTRAVVEAGAVPIFINLLSSPSADIRDQSAWCLGNIAGDSPPLRDTVLFAGAMQPLLKNIVSPATPALLNNSVWALSNFCRGKPAPVLSYIASAIPVLASILQQAHADTKVDALWALSYISDGNDERIQAVVDCDLAPLLVELLGSEGSNVVTPALRTVGNIVSGNDEHTQAVLDAGLINRMPLLLQSPKRGIRKEACWVLSNIAAGTQAQIAQVFKGGMNHVVNLAMDAEWEVRKEAIWVLSNIATGGTSTQVMSVVECGAIDALCSILKINDTKMLLVALDAIHNILKVGSEHGKNYVSFVDECDGLMEIENLQEHESEEVYQHAIKIIETYFGVDDNMEDENLAPVVDGNTFSFGVSQKLDNSCDDALRGTIYNFAAI
eukprot:CCRYP_020616-RA/>CCRYP_020616-RA protein AED:0.21 eAED:0.21 QI:184/1/1/1/0.66/0.5/4/1925/527